MSDWASYSIGDFIPFSPDVYLSLLERMGEAFWPLHLLTLVIGVIALSLAATRYARISCAIIAPLWLFVGIAFFMHRYCELNWAGNYVAWGFFFQAAILALVATTGLGIAQPAGFIHPRAFVGAALAFTGLLVYPLVAPITGLSWFHSEVFGIHPDPTATVTLGIILISLRGIMMWLAAAICTTWLAASGLTLGVLDIAWASALFVLAALGLSGLVLSIFPAVAFGINNRSWWAMLKIR